MISHECPRLLGDEIGQWNRPATLATFRGEQGAFPRGAAIFHPHQDL